MKKLVLAALFLLLSLSLLAGCRPARDYTDAVLESSLLRDLQAVEDNLSAMAPPSPEASKNDFPALRALLKENETIFERIEMLLSELEPKTDAAQQAHHHLVTALSSRRAVNLTLAALIDALEALREGAENAEQKETLQSLQSLISEKNAAYTKEIRVWQDALELEWRPPASSDE